MHGLLVCFPTVIARAGKHGRDGQLIDPFDAVEAESCFQQG